MSQPTEKRFIVRKYVMARSAAEAIERERDVRPDDVWVDEDWKKAHEDQVATTMGFGRRRK